MSNKILASLSEKTPKKLQFLKDHCFGILLLLYLPGWLIVLELIASFSKVHHSPYVIAALLTVSLVVCSVAEAARMAREDDPKLSVFCLIALDILFLVFVFPAYGELWLKQDYNDTLSNMVLIYRRMEAYQMEHGNYPPQQDLKSLLKTLDIKQSDLNGKGFFYDVGSAEYHAPKDIEGANDRYMDPVLSVRIRQTLFGKSDKLLVLRLCRVARESCRCRANQRGSPCIHCHCNGRTCER